MEIDLNSLDYYVSMILGANGDKTFIKDILAVAIVNSKQNKILYDQASSALITINYTPKE